MATASGLYKQAELQVLNHSIFVWGGSGQLCKNVNEAWIRKKEANNEGGKHADEAVAAWKAVMASPYADVARCFDCSGYVSYCLKQIGALKDRTNCDGLYTKCEPTETVENGTLLFRVNPKDPNDETHVGMYFDGKQYHAKGRADGVVAEAYRSSFWAKTAWFKALKHDDPQPTPTPQPEPTPAPSTDAYVLVLGSVRVRASAPKGTCIMIAHKGDMLPYLGETVTLDDGSEWYYVSTKNGYGYISAFTNKKRKYTKLIGA